MLIITASDCSSFNAVVWGYKHLLVSLKIEFLGLFIVLLGDILEKKGKLQPWLSHTKSFQWASYFVIRMVSSCSTRLPGVSPLFWLRKDCIPSPLPPALLTLMAGWGYEECLWHWSVMIDSTLPFERKVNVPVLLVTLEKPNKLLKHSFGIWKLCTFMSSSRRACSLSLRNV